VIGELQIEGSLLIHVRGNTARNSWLHLQAIVLVAVAAKNQLRLAFRRDLIDRSTLDVPLRAILPY
jgi:hypothetical protein